MLTLLNILAGIALLVWGTYLVRTSMLRAFGAQLRRFLSVNVSNRFMAVLAGLGVTTLLQSSTATALLTTSFAGSGLIATAPALAIMLGADIGTALAAVFLSRDLSWLWPLLIFFGVVLFLSKQRSTAEHIGGVAIGLGLMMLALHLIVSAARPLTQTVGVKAIFTTLSGDPLLDLVLAAAITLLAYSSLAVVLLVATITGSHVIGLDSALPLVLGANIGSGALAVLMTLKSPAEVRRVPLGNLFFKVGGSLLALPFVQGLANIAGESGFEPAQVVIGFHLVFNIVLGAICVALIERVAALTVKLIPAAPATQDEARARHLDPHALATPSLAFSCASREALRIGDYVEQMLLALGRLMQDGHRASAEEIRRLDDVVDSLYKQVKFYLTQVSRTPMVERDSRKWTDIISVTINLEQVGDIIEKAANDVVTKNIERSRSFSDAGRAELADLHARLLANLRLAMNVFMNNDVGDAEKLLAEKVKFRELEMENYDKHLARLADNTVQSIETSSLHLDLIRDLKRINSHFCSVAYPILEAAGALSESRLRAVEHERSDVTITGGGRQRV